MAKQSNQNPVTLSYNQDDADLLAVELEKVAKESEPGKFAYELAVWILGEFTRKTQVTQAIEAAVLAERVTIKARLRAMEVTGKFSTLMYATYDRQLLTEAFAAVRPEPYDAANSGPVLDDIEKAYNAALADLDTNIAKYMEGLK